MFLRSKTVKTLFFLFFFYKVLMRLNTSHEARKFNEIFNIFNTSHEARKFNDIFNIFKKLKSQHCITKMPGFLKR